MTGKADAALTRLFSSAEKLNEVSDEVSKQIKNIESALVAHGTGVSAWVELAAYSLERSGHMLDYTEDLGFDKHEGKWGLLFSLYCDQFGEAHISLLRDTSRDIRIKALEKIPDLIEKLAAETLALTEKAITSAAATKEIVDQLKKHGRK